LAVIRERFRYGDRAKWWTEDDDLTWSQYTRLVLVARIRLLLAIGYSERAIARMDLTGYGTYYTQASINTLKRQEDYQEGGGLRVRITKELRDTKNKPIPPGEYRLFLSGKHISVSNGRGHLQSILPEKLRDNCEVVSTKYE